VEGGIVIRPSRPHRYVLYESVGLSLKKIQNVWCGDVMKNTPCTDINVMNVRGRHSLDCFKGLIVLNLFVWHRLCYSVLLMRLCVDVTR